MMMVKEWVMNMDHLMTLKIKVMFDFNLCSDEFLPLRGFFPDVCLISLVA